jgi:hypothetical protein
MHDVGIYVYIIVVIRYVCENHLRPNTGGRKPTRHRRPTIIILPRILLLCVPDDRRPQTNKSVACVERVKFFKCRA